MRDLADQSWAFNCKITGHRWMLVFQPWSAVVVHGIRECAQCGEVRQASKCKIEHWPVFEDDGQLWRRADA